MSTDCADGRFLQVLFRALKDKLMAREVPEELEELIHLAFRTNRGMREHGGEQ